MFWEIITIERYMSKLVTEVALHSNFIKFIIHVDLPFNAFNKFILIIIMQFNHFIKYIPSEDQGLSEPS